MDYLNKFDVLWDVERNENKIFEMVVSKFIKNVLSPEDANAFGDINVSETFKQIIGTTNYEEFFNKYENTTNPYAKLIIELVENLHTLNIYKFESMEEHLCLIEANSNNKDLIHGELLANVDDELASFELTKSLKDKVAGIIKDDLERTAQEAENDAKLKDDLDDISTDEGKDKDKEENDGDAYENDLATDDDTGNDENPDADEDTKKFLSEAAKFDIDTMTKDYEDASLEDVLKDMKVYDLDAGRTGLGKAWDDFKTNIKTVLKSSVDQTEVEIADIKDEKMKKDYVVGVLVDRTSPYMSELLAIICKAAISGVAAVGIIFAANLLIAGIWLVIYFMLVKDINKNQLRAAASVSITINAIKTLKEMKAKAKNDDDVKKYDIMIDDLMKRQGIKQKDIMQYEKQMQLVKDMNDGYLKVKENYSIDMTAITSNIITEIRESGNIEEMDAHIVASSATLAATIFLVAEMFGLKTKEEIEEMIKV